MPPRFVLSWGRPRPMPRGRQSQKHAKSRRASPDGLARLWLKRAALLIQLGFSDRYHAQQGNLPRAAKPPSHAPAPRSWFSTGAQTPRRRRSRARPAAPARRSAKGRRPEGPDSARKARPSAPGCRHRAASPHRRMFFCCNVFSAASRYSRAVCGQIRLLRTAVQPAVHPPARLPAEGEARQHVQAVCFAYIRSGFDMAVHCKPHAVYARHQQAKQHGQQNGIFQP